MSARERGVWHACGTEILPRSDLSRAARRPLRQAPRLPLHLPRPCRRLAVKDAEGAAQRSKILDGEGHGHNLSCAARPPCRPWDFKPSPAETQSFPAPTHTALQPAHG